MTVATSRKQNKRPAQTREPLWKGPVEDGITFSLLSDFLECKERFRLEVVEGLSEDEGFRDVLEFGSMWHICEEHHRDGKSWQNALRIYTCKLKIKYPESAAEIEKWESVCKVQFPVYLKVWADHITEASRTSLFNEQSFRIPYILPSGRTITLRGKIDGAHLLYVDAFGQFREIGSGGGEWVIYTGENKTKGKLDEVGLTSTLHGNLQTCFYQTASRRAYDPEQFLFDFGDVVLDCRHLAKNSGMPKIAGVAYNVVLRPLGMFQKHSIKQKVSESQSQFMVRLAKVIEDNYQDFFYRWTVDISDTDLDQFKLRTLHPLLEHVLDWWEHISVNPFDPWTPRAIRNRDGSIPLEAAFGHKLHPGAFVPNSIHWQSPWGVYNSLSTGTRGSFFKYLTTGDKSGLTRVSSLFPELES